jgi:transcriptional regulator with XRE-family HTH domain
VDSVLPPFWTDAPKRQAPRSPSYAGLVQRAHFVTWLRQERERRGISRKQLARAVWPGAGEATTARIKAYETVKVNEQGRPVHVMLPSPDTLRKMCNALAIPWTSTFTLAGYYREILDCLAALAELGKRWLQEDGIVTDLESGLNFRSVGVKHFGDFTVWYGLKMRRYQQRYISGTIAQHTRRSFESQIIDTSSQEVAEQMQRLMQQFGDRHDRFSYVVPKPIAVALLVVASGFPRRGDVWKRDANVYAVRLLEAATPLLEYALKETKVKLSGNIQRADQVLSDVQLPIDGRRVVAAEHLISWADAICQGYTHYARLASMEYFGVAGSTIDNITPEYELPQIRRARLPYVEQFGRMELP